MGERLITAILDRPKKILFLQVLATIAMTAGISRLTADTDVTHDLPKKLPARALYERISEMFPAKEMIVVGIESNRLFTVDGVAALDRLTKRIDAKVAVWQNHAWHLKDGVVLELKYGKEYAKNVIKSAKALAEALFNCLFTLKYFL